MGKHKQNRRETTETFLVNENDLAIRKKHMAVRLDNSVVFFGGDLEHGQFIASAPMCEIYVYNIHIEQWTIYRLKMSDHAVPEGTESACAVVIGTDIFVHGGKSWRSKDHNKEAICCSTDALWKLSKRKHNDFIWQKITFKDKESIPSPRALHSGWEHNQKMWTFGGQSVSPEGYLSTYGDFQKAVRKLYVYGDEYFCNQLNYFSPQCKQWTNIECVGAVPSPRFDFGCTKINDSVYVHGGINEHYFDSNDFHQLNMSTMTWVKLADAPMHRYGHSLTAANGSQILLHGGCSHGNYHKDTWIFDLHTMKWKEVTKKEHIARNHHTATMANSDHIIIIGGNKKNECTVSHIHLRHQPKSLEKLALRSVYKHKKKLTPKEFQMPRSTYDNFRDMII